MKQKADPARLLASQVLADFIERFDTWGACIICLRKEQVYLYARWSEQENGELGRIWALGLARDVDPTRFDACWRGALVTQQAPPVLDAPSAEYQLPPGLNDEETLNYFIKNVDCEAAILCYLVDFTPQYFWSWYKAAGRRWAIAFVKRPQNPDCEFSSVNFQAGIDLAPGQIHPGNLHQVIAYLAGAHKSDWPLTSLSKLE